jgi:hypothetical protein
MKFWKWLIEELKANAIRILIDGMFGLIILLYTLHRIQGQYDNIQSKVNATYDLVATTIKAQAAKVDTASAIALQDFKDGRKED